MTTPEQRCMHVAQTNASFAHEGFELTPFMAQLQRRYIEGEIDLATMRQEIARHWENRGNP